MPTYSYECLKCSYEFEAFQKMSEKPFTNCPQCKGNVKRLIGSGCGLIFKGKGFYVTDYKRSSSAGASGKEAKAPSQDKKKKSASSCPGQKDNKNCKQCPH